MLEYYHLGEVFRFSLFLCFISVLFTEIFDNIEKENLLMKKKNLELQEQVVILEKSVQTLTEEKKCCKYREIYTHHLGKVFVTFLYFTTHSIFFKHRYKYLYLFDVQFTQVV